MSTTLAYSGTLTILRCGVCQIPHAIPTEMYDNRLANGGEWYCPNGHNLHFVTTKSEKLEKELAEAKRAASIARASRQAAWDQIAAHRRSAAAVRGWNTRLRNRIANGVCPVAGCRRHFDQVQAHIEAMHPDWAAEHPEALS